VAPRSSPPKLPSDPIIAAFVALVADAPVVGFIKDVDGRYVYANRYLRATVFDRMKSGWLGATDAEIWPPDVAAVVHSSDQATLRGKSLQVFTQAMPVGDESHAFLVMKLPLVLTDGRVYLGGIGVDQTAGLLMGAERNLLASVVEEVGESVMIADLDSRITYVNAAFERATGYTRDEVLGQNARILNSGVQSRSFYEAMWGALRDRSLWASDFVNRRKDGSLFTEQVVISAIRDASAGITGYVAVKRDVTRERALEQRSARLARERVLIAETLRGLRTGDTPEDTAQAICRQVLGLSGVAAAQLFVFEVDGRAVTIGFAIADQPDPPLQRLPSVPSRDLRSRAAQGPWIQSWAARPGDPYYEELKGLGAHLVASAPVRANDDLIGLLVIDALESADEATFAESLAALVEFADLAAALIARDVADRTEARRAKAQIREIIDSRAFEPVFQPIIDLKRDAIVGYEALTRFAGGASPVLLFGEAAAIGLGPDLEIATLTAAWAAAKALPGSAWLSLNVSPALIMSPKPLRGVLRGTKREIVFEVTEHAEIADYKAFRSAFADLGPSKALAVDDAGAGFASLRHILELRPAYVKLDRWLIAGLDSDEARQAMIVGLRHFARSTGCLLIAEGVETAAELSVLRTLEVDLAQGYVLGRPAPVDEL
jgi:PAS domain S-box-containing protein